jgi:hypothetical protein
MLSETDEREECYFLVNGQECPNMRDLPPHPFCSEHRAIFAGMDNPSLIERGARAMRELMYVNSEKKLTAKNDREGIDAVINILHELNGRGYTNVEATDAMGDFTKDRGLLDDLLKEMGNDPKWKKFEKLITGIHMLTAEGAEVKFNDHILGKRSGSNRQIDVSIRFKQGFYDYLAIVECKDYGTKVEMGEVEAFRTKMEDVGAMHGIMVSPHGFQKGAITTAEAYNIELFTLTEVKSDWTKKIKADVLTLPFATRIEFDYPDFEMPEPYKAPLPLEFDKMLFYEDQHKDPLTLQDLVMNVTHWVIEQKLELPCIVDAPLGSPLLTQFPGTNFYTPIYALTITFEPHKFAVGYEIDMPPKAIKYIYSDLAKERVHEIPADKVPKVK